MRILIITYSREVNPGTFLQAYGVQYAFKQVFPNADIELLRHKRLYNLSGLHKGESCSKNTRNLKWFLSRLSAIPRRLKYEYDNFRKFKFSRQEFGLFDYDKDEFKTFAESYDLIVVGSDTILIDLKKNEQYGLMWLLDIKTNKILFAASASPAKYNLTDEEVKMLHENFSNFHLLGVRDSVTYKLLSERIGLGENVYRQYDPTYLVPESCFSFPLYLRLRFRYIHRKRKIALVNFGDNFDGKKIVTMYLQQRGFYVISTIRNEWADSNIMTLSAFGWAAMFKYVDFVLTERFHDSVFALRNNKTVVAIDWAPNRFASDGSSKIQCLFESYGILDMHFTYESDIHSLCHLFYACVDRDISSVTKKINSEIHDDYAKKMNMIKELFIDKV